MNKLELFMFVIAWLAIVIVALAILFCVFGLFIQLYWHKQTKHIPPMKGQCWSDGLTHYEIEAADDDIVVFKQSLIGSERSIGMYVTPQRWLLNLNKNKLYLLKE